MESGSFISGGKGFVSDESVSTPEGIARGKIGSMGWEFKTPFSFGSNMVVCPNQEGIENQGFGELGFPPMMKSSVSSGTIRDILDSKMGFTQNAFSEEEEFSSKLSSSVVESNCWDSSLIDLKLGGFFDQRDSQNFNCSPNLSSAELSVPAKRTRMVGFNSPTPFCQVYGCKKNLSSSKDYHKRHKVCEVHSKTAKVIVNGIEQRFCQQCSRFHLLAEFDDGKRSCRKRLAGHNERRRKPHMGVHSGRPGRLLPSYNSTREGSAGSRGSTVAPSSFMFQDIIARSFSNPYQHKYETNDWCHIKFEDGTAYDLQSPMSSIADEQLHSKTLYPSGFGKHYPSLHGNGVNTAIGNIFDGSSNRYPHDIGDFIIIDSSSAVQGQSGIVSETGRALSLLSSQSQSNSSHSSRIPIAHPHPLLILGSQNAPYNLTTQIPENPLGVSPQASVTGVSNNFCPSGIGSVEESHLDPILLSDGSDTENFGIDGIFQGSTYLNSTDQACWDDGSTIDLLQLLSQLQRVEHQKQDLCVKQENDKLVGLSIT